MIELNHARDQAAFSADVEVALRMAALRSQALRKLPVTPRLRSSKGENRNPILRPEAAGEWGSPAG